MEISDKIRRCDGGEQGIKKMAENSAIEWTDATVNFWWGCTKVGPGCDHCYAETWSKRTGQNLWGVGAPRREIKGANKLIIKMDDGAAKFQDEHGRRRRVFIQSMSDLFDNEVPQDWFVNAWHVMEMCRGLDIQIVTKRISNVEKRFADRETWVWPKHIGLMVTVCNQDEADRDVPRLLELKGKLGIPWVGVSAEPLLGPIDFQHIPVKRGDGISGVDALSGSGLYVENADGDLGAVSCEFPALDWIIVGGESGPGARPMHPAWPRSIRDQCAAEDVPFLFKQWGEWAPVTAKDWEHDDGSHQHCFWTGSRWGETLGEYLLAGDCQMMRRAGKKRAGRLLDGVEHNGYPQTGA